MPRPVQPTATSPLALEGGSAPAGARLITGALGEAGSRDALARLNDAVRQLKALAVEPLLERAVEALRGEDHDAGAKLALQALEQDERNGFGWYLLAIARERAGDFPNSIAAYESALKLLPDHAEIANDLGRLAFRLGMRPQAEKLFRHFLARHPNHPEGANNLACAIRDQGRGEEAIEILRAAITQTPDVPMLWNTLGTVVAEQGDYRNAMIFLEEALRLQPDFPKARYNLGNAKLVLGDLQGADSDCKAALAGVKAEEERQMMRLARSTILIAQGRIGEGWDEYEARLHPQFAEVTQFLVDRPRWSPGDDLAGRALLVIGEQGLGDEVLFANTLPDVIRELGPGGRLAIAVEKRLVPFFQRSFPAAQVSAHATYDVGGRFVRAAPEAGDLEQFDLWTPMGSLLRAYRRSLKDFPHGGGYMQADPQRVAYWRDLLAEQAPAGRKVGLLWKSAVNRNSRNVNFSSFEEFGPVLTTPGVAFVNMQYDDCSRELAWAAEEHGVRIWTPPGIDLKADLDEIAALGCALDLTVGFSNATFNLAASAGAPAFLISPPAVWPRLGADYYAWYPQVRLFVPEISGEWMPVMDRVARALAEFAAER